MKPVRACLPSIGSQVGEKSLRISRTHLYGQTKDRRRPRTMACSAPDLLPSMGQSPAHPTPLELVPHRSGTSTVPVLYPIYTASVNLGG
jgi:hypothetical protein